MTSSRPEGHRLSALLITVSNDTDGPMTHPFRLVNSRANTVPIATGTDDTALAILTVNYSQKSLLLLKTTEISLIGDLIKRDCNSRFKEKLE